MAESQRNDDVLFSKNGWETSLLIPADPSKPFIRKVGNKSYVVHRDKEYGPFDYVNDLTRERGKPLFTSSDKNWRAWVHHGDTRYGPFDGSVARLRFVEGKPFCVIKKDGLTRLAYGNEVSVEFEELVSVEFTEFVIIARVRHMNAEHLVVKTFAH